MDRYSALLAAPGEIRAINWDALGEFLLIAMFPVQPQCSSPFGSFLLDVLPSGRTAELRSRYFTPPIASVAPDVASITEAAQLLTSALDDAVRIRMRSDAPFGAYLSGGMTHRRLFR